MREKRAKSELKHRELLKSSFTFGTGTQIKGYTKTKNPLDKEIICDQNTCTKEHEEFPIEINKDFKRFNACNTVFLRGLKGETPELAKITQIFAGGEEGHTPPSGKIGYTEIESALASGAWSVTNTTSPYAQYGVSNTGLYSWEESDYSKVNNEERKTYFDSPEEASRYIKRAAQIYSADLCGITKYNEKWTYTDYYDPRDGKDKKINLPFKPKSTIVLAYAMDYESFLCSPSFIEAAATANMYSDMATRTYKLATFIRRLGYNAIPCGNDTGMSIPMAIEAGLGELSRMGLLITEKYGPRIRLSKIFTDLDLEIDKPITLGVRELCESCMKCADNCPSEAITKDIKPSYKVPTISNITGVKKWTINSEKCFKFWSENGCCCANCIATCPFNKRDEWQQNLTKLENVTPDTSPISREFTELFGYNKVFNEGAYKKFWENK